MNDKLSLGFRYNQEVSDLEREIAIEKGLPPNIFNSEVFFEAQARYIDIHKNDKTYQEVSKRIASYEPQFPDHTRQTIDLTNEEIDYMLEKLFGVNDVVGINLKNKLMRKM